MSHWLRSLSAITLAVGLLVAGAAPPLAAGETYEEIGEPTVKTTIQGENVVAPGETRTLSLGLRNTGVTVSSWEGQIDSLSNVVQSQGIQPGAALSTTARVRSGGAPVDVRTGQQSVGTVAADSDQSVPVRIEVDDNAAPGTYRLPVEVEYRYISTIIVDGSENHVVRNDEAVRRYVTVRVDPRARLSVVSLSGEGLTDGADGRLHATVRNTGSETATDAVLRLERGGSLTPRTNDVGLGDLASDETATATFRVGVGDVESTTEQAVGLSLRHEDGDGDVHRTPVRVGRVRLSPGPQFAVSAEPESLYVDSVGAVRLTVRNVGSTPAEAARVRLAESAPLVPVTDRANLGRLAPGETATARFRIEVADRALAGEYPLSVVVARDDLFGESVASDTRTVPVTVGGERTISTGSASDIAAGSTTTVSFEVTNTGPGPMRDAVVRLNADAPFETDDDTAYVGGLAPGETATVSFTVSVDAAATPKRYALDTTAKYDNAFGRRVVTDIESTSVRVRPGGGGLLAALLDIVGL